MIMHDKCSGCEERDATIKDMEARCVCSKVAEELARDNERQLKTVLYFQAHTIQELIKIASRLPRDHEGRPLVPGYDRVWIVGDGTAGCTHPGSNTLTPKLYTGSIVGGHCDCGGVVLQLVSWGKTSLCWSGILYGNLQAAEAALASMKENQ